MMNAIRHDETPNFYFMQYELATWRVKNLLLVPSFAFPPSAIIKRKPLSSTARRAGWVGCNIALSRIPIEARIAIVTESSISPESNVREKFRRVKPLKEISVTQRGWTLDVLNAIRRLGKTSFTTADPAMRDLHP
jgi:type II restriction enzyme